MRAPLQACFHHLVAVLKKRRSKFKDFKVVC